MEKWTIYNKSGVAKYIATDLEYHDIWMGEEYVTIKITSPTPIELEIGDYLIYRDDVYSIYTLPSALKQARKSSNGEAFKYENVKMSARSAELSEVRFLDVVLYDNNIHYTSLPTFSFYAETIDDLVDRLQANTDRYNGEWLYITPNYNRTIQRYADNPTKKAAAITLWEQTFGTDHSNPTAAVENEKFNVNISVDKISVSQGLEFIKNNFGLNFITKGRALIVGGKGLPVDHVFRYGKNKGLYAIERKAEQDQQVVTRLFAYGSDKNLPIRYYADLNKQFFLNVVEIKNKYNSVSGYIGVVLLFDIDFSAILFTKRSSDYPGTDEFPCYIITMEANGYTIKGYVTKNTSSDNRCRLYAECADPDHDDRDERSPEQMNGFVAAIKVGDKVIIKSGIDKNYWPTNHIDYAEYGMPNNMAVNTLMLPGFPRYALSELCKTEIVDGTTHVYVRKNPETAWGEPLMSIEGEHILRFSNERLRPYITSGNADEIGIKEGNIQFNEENDDNGLQEVYPSIEGMTVGDVFGTSSTERLDEIRAADVIQDNGVFEPEAEIEPFKIKLKDIGFDLEEAVENTGSLTISMKDGYCGARDFEVKNIVKDGNSGWILTLDRYHDDALDLWFPYSSHAAIGEAARADEAYQIRVGDHFVLLDIDISDSSYIWAASVKMLRKSIYWLINNNYTRFTYLPKIDEIFMARQHERAQQNPLTTISLHDTLKAGMLMLFNDEDLDVDGSVFIDNITIKENGNNGVPTYEVVLRNDKQVGTLQRVQQQVNSLSSYVYNGGGGYSVSQINAFIKRYGQEYFLSKLTEDVAAGRITFAKGLKAMYNAWFGEYHREHPLAGDELDTGASINAEGTADFIDLIVRGLVKGTLNVEDLLKVKNLIFSNELKSEGARSGFLDGTGIYMNAKDGLIEADGMNVRGFLRVMELIINRLQLMESDYSFTEGDTTERVDFSDNGQRMVLTMHKDHDNDHTPFYPGDILYAKINDLLDHGTYYTCHVRVVSVDLTNNTMKVVPYNGVKPNGDPEVPGAKNFTFLGTEITDDYTEALLEDYTNNPNGYEKIITLTRRGNIADGLENGDDPTSYSDSVKNSQLGRQQSWVLSTTDKRLSFFWNVDKPIIEDNNYALCLGILPDLANLPHDAQGNPIWNVDMPSLYVNTIFYDHSHDANYPARVVKEDRGQWVLPDSTIPQPTSEYNGTTIFEPYHYKTYTRATWLRYRNDASWSSLTDAELHQKMMNEFKVDLEISRVWCYGILWECLVDGTTQEPHWGCTHWQAIGGDAIYKGEITTSNGRTFSNGNIDTVLTMRIWYGDEEITDQILTAVDYSIAWKRSTGYNNVTEEFVQQSEDLSWTPTIVGTNKIKVVRSDMGSGWMITYRKALISCTVSFSNEGQVVTMPADYVF